MVVTVTYIGITMQALLGIIDTGLIIFVFCSTRQPEHQHCIPDPCPDLPARDRPLLVSSDGYSEHVCDPRRISTTQMISMTRQLLIIWVVIGVAVVALTSNDAAR